MFDDLIHYASIVIIPILCYLGCLAIFRYISKSPKVLKVKIPLHISFFFTFVLLLLYMAGVDTSENSFKALAVALSILVFFIILRILELFVLDELLIKTKVNLPTFVRDILRFTIIILACAVALKIGFGIEPSAIIVTSTVMSAIIGLALQDMLANIISGVALQIESPFEVGDWVNINESEGQVLEMSWRSTKIRTRTNDILVTPNTAIAQNDILNFCSHDDKHLCSISIGVSYDVPPNQVKTALMSILRETKGILDNPEPEVFLNNYGDFSIDYLMRAWINDYSKKPKIIDAVMTRVWYVLQRQNISIPYPIHDVRIANSDAEERRKSEHRQRKHTEAIEAMQQIAIFELFTRESLLNLAKMAHYRLFAPGEFLVRQGTRDASYFIIQSGEVDVLTQVGTHREVVGHFAKGYCFGEISLLTGTPRSASVVATTEVNAIIIDKDSFGILLSEHPEMAEILSKVIKQRSTELEQFRHETKVEHHQEEVNQTKTLDRIRRFFNLD